MEINSLTDVVVATGALGTAAFGIVEGLKPWQAGRASIGLAGFGQLRLNLGPLWDTLSVAFGPNFELMLQGLYRGDRAELERTLRQGVRIGLTAKNAEDMAEILHTIDGAELKKAAAAIEAGKALPDNLKNVVGRFELAADARVDSALSLAQARYVGGQKVTAMVVALAIAIIAGIWLSPGDDYTCDSLVQSLVVGLAAVPLAPVAKDVATALQSAAQALRRKA